MNFKFVKSPILNTSITPRLFLAGYIKSLLLPPDTALENMKVHPLPETARTPEWVGWKTKGLIEGLEDCKGVKGKRKFDVGGLFKYKNTEEGTEIDIREGQIIAR